ncbi:ABC transporter permease [Phytoactinopolyspora halotolerans]|uniref:ABC transporter permease n=1 Tax=Phytoactinopolyspora halotolerans TaxID=1981512 RepID=A0A6L9S7Z1_9ACTN|nr:ABC transporter permease [Phytoactinopolyspora halotolerans]NEE00090.1 ABC transporter permease [Phytoactinopolyspora halotolerans]
MTDTVLAERAAPTPRSATIDADLPRRPRRLGRILRYVPHGIIAVYIVVAAVGPLVVDYDPLATSVTDRLLSPGSTTSDGGTAWLGTDGVGRDILDQVVLGARTSMVIAVLTVAAAGTFGVIVGLIAGYVGGWADASIARLIDILVAFPGILLAIVIAGLFRPGILIVVLALSAVGWISFARVVRGASLSLRERDWVNAARVMAVPRRSILGRHVLPFVVGPVVAMATLEFALVVLAEAGLSFLGIGLPSTSVSWGQTIADGKEYLELAPWISAFPGVALAVLVICVGLVGDQLTARYGGNRR